MPKSGFQTFRFTHLHIDKKTFIFSQLLSEILESWFEAEWVSPEVKKKSESGCNLQVKKLPGLELRLHMPISYIAKYTHQKILKYLKNESIFCISNFRNDFITKFWSRKHIFRYENIKFIFLVFWQSNGGRTLSLVIMLQCTCTYWAYSVSVLDYATFLTSIVHYNSRPTLFHSGCTFYAYFSVWQRLLWATWLLAEACQT